jgi:glycosyltransferase involved in cell wall biosynthesis
VHDYYALCPQINLLPFRHSLYCGEPDVAGCNACIANRMSHGARDIVTWRGERAWQFREAERVFCPSRDVVARLERFGVAENAVLAPHEPVAAGPWPLRRASPASGRLRVAVLGTLVNHKGARTVASVAELADAKRVEVHLIGHVDGPFPQQALKRMKVSGPYDDADLGRLIEKIAPHVIWFPAVWPETFSYTMSAAIDAGAAIAATQIGAHAERLEGRPLTWLAEVGTSPAGWLELFEDIRCRLAGAQPPAPPRTAVEDFYALHYLRPDPPTRHRVRPSRPRIAVMPERFDIGFPTPCGYIRLVQPLHHPAITQHFEVISADSTSMLDCEADIIVTQRHAVADLKTADRLAAHARRSGAVLVYDLDDDLLDIPVQHPDAKVLRPRAKVVRRMLDVADQVWVSTSALAVRLAELRPDALVMENALDERIWTPPAAPAGDQPVRILCMGTATHDADFAMIEPALVRLKGEYGDRVDIDVVGMTNQNPLPPGLNRLSASTNGRRSYPGFVNWLTGRQPAWQIGLAPLLDTPFNRCKSPIKAMDYAALGVAVLASDTAVYRGSVADGPAGRLVANSEADWYRAVDDLLRDRDRRLALAGGAHAAFLARASLASQGRHRRDAWMQLLERRRTDAA